MSGIGLSPTAGADAVPGLGDRLKRLATKIWRKPKRRRRRVRPQGPGLVNHDQFRAVDPYSFQVAHTRLAWMFRASVMLNAGLFGCVIVLASAIATLVPLKSVEMGLVRIEGDAAKAVDPASLVRIIPITKETPGFGLLMESFVRRYTRILLEIDRASQDDRMREANLYSDADWWTKFIQDRKKEIGKAVDSGLDRSIVVESADRISLRDGIARYAVDLVQTDKRDGKVVETKKLRAYVAVTSRPHTVRDSEKFENPLGIRVLDLSLKEKGNN